MHELDDGRLRRRERLREDFRHGAFMVRKRVVDMQWRGRIREDGRELKKGVHQVQFTLIEMRRRY